MIEEILTLAEPAFLPTQHAIQVEAYLGFSAVLSLEVSPPLLCIPSGDSWTRRAATEVELQTILNGLQADPPKPPWLTPIEVLARFTDAEQDAIDMHAKRLARRLFSAIEPISWDVFAASVAELQASDLITEQQAARILA